MIVDPDFLTHWRTLMLIDELDGDEMAPLYVIRLWGHCQQRRSDIFEMPTTGLKALCRYRGDAEKLEAALVSSGFLERQGICLMVPKWKDHNAALVKNWANGGKGGRPKQQKTETQTEPNRNPNRTHGEPNENPRRTQPEPIGEEVDRSRQEKPKTVSPSKLCTDNSACDSDPPPSLAPSTAGLVCKRLRQAGVQGVNPSNPKLLALLNAGLSEGELADLAAEPRSKGKGFAWLLAAAEGRRRDAGTIRPLPRASPSAIADRNRAAAEAAKQMIFGQEAQRATG